MNWSNLKNKRVERGRESGSEREGGLVGSNIAQVREDVESLLEDKRNTLGGRENCADYFQSLESTRRIEEIWVGCEASEMS